MESKQHYKGIDRRHFLKNSMTAAGAGAFSAAAAVNTFGSSFKEEVQGKDVSRLPWRVGAVAYGFEYSIALFSSNKRTGPRMDVFGFIEATHKAGGDVAQVYISMVENLDKTELKRLRDFAASLDIMIELHGGSAQSPKFENVINIAEALGSKIAGCSFGMLMRPNKIATLDEWDKHYETCRSRLKQLVDIATTKKITVAVENHLDFTVQELHDLVASIDSPYAGVVFDVGNTIGTLDSPVDAAAILGPFIVATHYKDFAIEETARGFRFTMVPLGAGSLNLPDITKALYKYLKPGMGISIEMINGQQFEVNWMEDRFWVPYRNHSARNVAATLRHIRSTGIDISEFKPESEISNMAHDARWQFEFDRMQHCIQYLKNLLADVVKES